MTKWGHCLTVSLLLGLAAPLGAAEANDTELANELIHSDVPLWGPQNDQIWPSHFSRDDGSFGCASRVDFGDWQFKGDGGEARWWRFRNYGVLHCAILERRSDERGHLHEGQSHYSFVVKIGETRRRGEQIELWALQSGTRPGSDYTLLSREPGKGIIRSFTVLQRVCPRKKLRKGPSLDIWMTRYCAINSRHDLMELAKRMASMPSLGTLAWIGPIQEQQE